MKSIQVSFLGHRSKRRRTMSQYGGVNKKTMEKAWVVGPTGPGA